MYLSLFVGMFIHTKIENIPKAQKKLFLVYLIFSLLQKIIL